jgi:hypothetical protein
MPARVRHAIPHLLVTLDTPADAPRPCGRSLEAGTVGWPDERHPERAAAQRRAPVSDTFHDYLSAADALPGATRERHRAVSHPDPPR